MNETGGCLVQVRCFLLACPPPLPLGAAVFSSPVSCIQLSALLFPCIVFIPYRYCASEGPTEKTEVRTVEEAGTGENRREKKVGKEEVSFTTCRLGSLKQDGDGGGGNDINIRATGTAIAPAVEAGYTRRRHRAYA